MLKGNLHNVLFFLNLLKQIFNKYFINIFSINYIKRFRGHLNAGIVDARRVNRTTFEE